MRDLNERKWLAELARNAPRPVITFTDGPMELWGAADPQGSQDFQRSLDEYQEVLVESEGDGGDHRRIRG